MTDIGLICWGEADQPQPVLSNPVQVSIGANHTCALADTGVAYWGRNYGAAIPELSNPVQVSTGGMHICALDDTGVVCWGDDYYGATDVPDLINPVQVAAGTSNTCALDDTGVVCWGGGNYWMENDVPEELIR